MEFSLDLSQKLGMLELIFDNKNYFLGIPIDSSTVFDIVNHQILLKKSDKIIRQNFQTTFKLSFKQKKLLGWGKRAHPCHAATVT